MTFQTRKAHLQGADMFHRFTACGEGEALDRSGLAPDHFLLVFERGGRKMALDARQMTYHHVAQGELSGEPYVVTF